MTARTHFHLWKLQNKSNFLPKIDHIKHKVSLNLKITSQPSESEIFPKFSKTSRIDYNKINEDLFDCDQNEVLPKCGSKELIKRHQTRLIKDSSLDSFASISNQREHK